MNPKTLFLPLLIAISVCTHAAPPEDSKAIYLERYKHFADSVEKTLVYQTGNIELEGGRGPLGAW